MRLRATVPGRQLLQSVVRVSLSRRNVVPMVATALSLVTAAGCGDEGATISTAASSTNPTGQQQVDSTGDVPMNVDEVIIEYSRNVRYECTGGVIAGEELTLRGTGFEPGAPVVAQYTVADSDEFIDAGEATAAGDGSVALVVTVPNDPIGTTSAYELTGLGADGELLLLNALVYFDGPNDECNP